MRFDARAAISRASRETGHCNRAGGYIVKDAGARWRGARVASGRGLLCGQLVQSVIGIALARIGLLIDQRHDAGECRGRSGSTADADNRAVRVAGVAIGPSDILGADHVEIAVESVAGEERHVRDIALAVIWYASSGLPGRLGVTAGATDDVLTAPGGTGTLPSASAGGDHRSKDLGIIAVGFRVCTASDDRPLRVRAGIVPSHFRNVRFCGCFVSVIRRIPIWSKIVEVVEISATHRCGVRSGGRAAVSTG